MSLSDSEIADESACTRSQLIASSSLPPYYPKCRSSAFRPVSFECGALRAARRPGIVEPLPHRDRFARSGVRSGDSSHCRRYVCSLDIGRRQCSLAGGICLNPVRQFEDRSRCGCDWLFDDAFPFSKSESTEVRIQARLLSAFHSMHFRRLVRAWISSL